MTLEMPCHDHNTVSGVCAISPYPWCADGMLKMTRPEELTMAKARENTKCRCYKCIMLEAGTAGKCLSSFLHPQTSSNNIMQLSYMLKIKSHCMQYAVLESSQCLITGSQLANAINTLRQSGCVPFLPDEQV